MSRRLPTPTRTAGGEIVGRPRKPPPAHVARTHAETPPADAGELIEDLAADGWTIVGIAWKLGTSKDVLNRWFGEAPALLEAFEVGRERERRTLHNEAFRMAMECPESNAKLRAIMFLLNSRHSYRESEPVDNSTRINIFNMQGPLSEEDYLKTVNASD